MKLLSGPTYQEEYCAAKIAYNAEVSQALKQKRDIPRMKNIQRA